VLSAKDLIVTGDESFLPAQSRVIVSPTIERVHPASCEARGNMLDEFT
jgi:hypothetical protein